MELEKGQSIQSLIVDDDKSIGEILKELVSSRHVSVQVFSDGSEAIKHLQHNPVDIVITDLMMPNVNGLDLLSFAKTKNPDSIVIIITGHGTLETAIEAVRKGAYDYIKKPFKLDEIQISFNNAVEKILLVRKNQELLERLKDACDELVAVKKGCRKSKQKNSTKTPKTPRLNFYSASLPNLESLRKANEDQQKFFERLHHISRLKKDGLLTEKEFKSLKSHIIKGLEIYAMH